MLLRRIARPMFASSFVIEGIDVLRHPGPHAELARVGLSPVLDRLPATSRVSSLRTPSTRQLITLVRIHAAAVTVAGLLLALGKAPRTAALALAALTLPSAAVSLPLPLLNSVDSAPSKDRRRRLIHQVSMAGGALLAGIDTEGRPGVGWRVSHARSERAASRAEHPARG